MNEDDVNGRKKQSLKPAQQMDQSPPTDAEAAAAAAAGEDAPTASEPTPDAAGGASGAGGTGAPPSTPQQPVEPPKFVVLQMPFAVSTESLKRFVKFLYTFEIQVGDANMRQVRQ